MRDVFQSDPKYVLSFNGFQNNDKHFINYLRTHNWSGEYITVDKCTNTIIPDTKFYEDPDTLKSMPPVDVIGCVAPCAGLSSLSPTSNPDSPVNDWMYKSATLALQALKPKIFWGENSIFLGTNKGKPVANKLAKIGHENNYHFLIYCTENRVHGNPQKRPRTFYFYFRKDIFNECPIIDKLEKINLTVEELLDRVKIVQKNDPMNITINREEKIEDNPFYQYWFDHHKVKSHRELVEKMSPLDNITNSPSLVGQACLFHKENMKVLENWMADKGYDKVVKRLQHIDTKFKQNKGAWLRGPQIDRGFIPAFVSDQVIFFVHPREKRYLTFREALSIMAMPYDFNMIGENLYVQRNHIAQNVCMSTAKIFSNEIKKIINGTNKNNYKLTNSYLIQDHRKDDKLETRHIIL